MPRERTSPAPSPSLMSMEPSLFASPSLQAIAPAELNIYQGDDKRWLFRLKKTGGTPFNLTGYTAALQFRLAVADTDAGLPVTPNVTVTDPAAGEITMTLLSDISKTLREPVYLWDLEITETATSWTTTIAVGTLVVTKEVTRLP